MSSPSPPKKLKTMADETKMNNVPDSQMAVPIKVEDSTDRRGKEPTPPPPLELQDLPDEVLLKVFTELRPQDLTSCAHSCRRWQHLISGRKRLWKGKIYTACKASHYKLALKMMQLMPKLETVRFVNSWRPALHLMYPEAVLVFSNGYFEASLPDGTFNADDVIVSSSVINTSQQNFLIWLNATSLKLIQVSDQCETSFTRWRTIFNFPAHRKYCNERDCALHMVKSTPLEVPLKFYTFPPQGLASAEWMFPSLRDLYITTDIVRVKTILGLCQLGPIHILYLKFGQPPVKVFYNLRKRPHEAFLLRKFFSRFFSLHTELFYSFLLMSKHLNQLGIQF